MYFGGASYSNGIRRGGYGLGYIWACRCRVELASSKVGSGKQQRVIKYNNIHTCLHTVCEKINHRIVLRCIVQYKVV